MAKLFAFSSSQYMTVNSAPVTAAPFTVSCWFKPTAFAANARFVSIGDVDVTNEQWSLGCNTLGRVRWGAQTSAGEAFATYTGAAMSVGTWYHCAGVEASATSRLAYLDAASATNTTSRAPAGADSLFIGAKAASTPSDFADGDIAEVGVWDVALTADEIAVLARGYSPLFVRPGNLIFYMPLVRANVEMVGGLALSEVNTPTVSTHCRVFYPARPYVSIPAAAGGGITQEIGQVTETDLAQSFTVLKLKQIGQPAEADTAQVFAPLKTEQIGQPTEADTAQPITVAKTAQIGQVVETNLAQIVTSLKTLAVNPVNEQDAAGLNQQETVNGAAVTGALLT
ncbi:LamG domain-containing protein, partial [Staphylococcus aureus]|uniref:LamG domain-containing protein n=1 Tax=Staphylococcus aureus TaxID=1280 RepID=UPI0023B0A8F2